jgi:hypothetical protein
MGQVIIYTNPEAGNVVVCYPSGDVPIEELQAQHTPQGSIIVDNSSLPYEDNDFFNAWELNRTTVTVNLQKAIAQAQENLDGAARNAAINRALNTTIGVQNTPSDTEWSAELASIRSAIAASTTTQELRTVIAGAKQFLGIGA